MRDLSLALYGWRCDYRVENSEHHHNQEDKPTENHSDRRIFTIMSAKSTNLTIQYGTCGKITPTVATITQTHARIHTETNNNNNNNWVNTILLGYFSLSPTHIDRQTHRQTDKQAEHGIPFDGASWLSAQGRCHSDRAGSTSRPLPSPFKLPPQNKQTDLQASIYSLKHPLIRRDRQMMMMTITDTTYQYFLFRCQALVSLFLTHQNSILILNTSATA